MLEGLVAWVLNNYLGKYVENLNTDQLSIAILSGEVELENLPLRKDALRHLGIPVEIRAGHIGKVKLQIPIRSLRSSPWVIVIEKLYIVAGPLNLEEWDQNAEDLADQERKLAALDAIEACWRLEADSNISGPPSSHYASSYSSWLSYGTGVITDIVENMQLHIKDVHLRFEDSTSFSSAFVCGITIESLTAQSCDMNWAPQFTSSRDGSDISFKTIELKNLAIYWDRIELSQLTSKLTPGELAKALSEEEGGDHRYLVSPVSACAKLQRNRSELPLRSLHKPRIICDLNLDQVPLAIIDWQYEQMVSCIKGLEFLSRVQNHRRRRPSVSISTDPRAWWSYACSCHVLGAQRERVTWGEALERARQNVQYVDLYTKLLAEPSAALGVEMKRLKDAVEWSRDFDELRALREVSMRRCPLGPVSDSAPQNIPLSNASNSSSSKESCSTGRNVLVRWFPQWWGWYSNPTTEQEVDRAPLPQPVSPGSSGARQLEDEILEALADSARNNTLLRRDVVFGRFNFTLNGGLLELCASSQPGKEGTPMLELQFSELFAEVVSRPRSSSYSLELRLGALFLRDRLTHGTLFPILVGPPGGTPKTSQSGVMGNLPRGQQFRNRQSPNIRIGSNPQLLISSDTPFFTLTYSSISSSFRRLHVTSRPLDVVYQPAAVKWLLEFICAPHQRSLARHRLEKMRERTKQQLTDTWGSILEGKDKEQHHKGWDLRLDISAPQLILVERFCDPSAAIAVVDLGTLRLENGFQQQNGVFPAQKTSPEEENEDDEAFMTPCSTPPGSEADTEETQTLVSALSELSFHQRIYDTYNIELSDIQVLVGRVKDNWRHAHTKGSSNLHVLDRFNISLTIERRIVPTTDPMYPSITLNANLPRLVAHINEQKISSVKILLKVISEASLPSPFGNSPAHENREIISPEEQEITSVTTPTVKEDGVEPSRLLTVQFTVYQMSLEVQSRGRSVAELQVSGVTLSLSRRPSSLTVSLTVHGLLLVDALQTFGPDFELLVASHRHVGMDSMSGSLFDSEPTSPTSPGSPDPSLAARVRATSPVALSKALREAVGGVAPDGEGGDTEALICVEYVLVRGEEGLQVASIQFNNLDIIANQETIVELVGFIRRVFPKKSTRPQIILPQRSMEGDLRYRSRTTSRSNDLENDIENDLENDLKEVKTRTELTFDFHRLNVLLLRATIEDGRTIGRKIGTATMCEAKIQATVDSFLFVKGSLGGLQVLDLTPEGYLHQRIISVGRNPLAEDILTVEESRKLAENEETNEETAFSFSVKRNLQEEINNQPVDVSIRMASVWYTHSPQFLLELRSCATEFKQYLSDVARSIRSAATDVALGLVHARTEQLAQSLYSRASLAYDVASPRRLRRRSTSSEPHTPFTPLLDEDFDESSSFENIDIHVDVVLNSPVLVLPRSSESYHVLVAHLGKITISNKRLPTDDVIQNGDSSQYEVEIRDMNICTLDTFSKRNTSGVGKVDVIYNCDNAIPILYNTLLKIQVVKIPPDRPEGHLINKTNDDFDVMGHFNNKTSDFESGGGMCSGGIGERGEGYFEVVGEPGGLLKIKGCVVNALRVSVTRCQYEQLLDTLQWLSKDEGAQQQCGAPTGGVSMTSIAEEDVGGVSTLSMDPHVRAKLFPSASRRRVNPPLNMTSSDVDDSISTAMKVYVKFEVASFGIELCNVEGAGLVGLSFGDFLLKWNTPRRFETEFEVSLRSLLVEDLLREKGAFGRQMISSKEDMDKFILIPPCVSKSCPDTSNFPFNMSQFGSLPDRLDTNQIFGAGPLKKGAHHQNLIQRSLPRSRGQDLILISSKFIDPNAPNFKTEFDSMRKSTHIDLGSIDVVVSANSWIPLMDFFSVNSEEVEDHKISTENSINPQKIGNSSTTISIRSLTIQGLRNVSNSLGKSLARAKVIQVDINITRQGPRRDIHGQLGALQIRHPGKENRTCRGERFVTIGERALDFRYSCPPKSKNVKKGSEYVKKESKKVKKESKKVKKDFENVEKDFENIEKEFENVEYIRKDFKNVENIKKDYEDVEKDYENVEKDLNVKGDFKKVVKDSENMKKDLENIKKDSENIKKDYENAENVQKDFGNIKKDLTIKRDLNINKDFENVNKVSENAKKDFENVQKDFKNVKKDFENLENVKKELEDLPDSELILKISPFVYVHTKKFIAELRAFFADFSQKKSQKTKKSTHQISRMSFRLSADACITLFPVINESSDLLVLDVGRLTAENTFTQTKLAEEGSSTSEEVLNLDVTTWKLHEVDFYIAKAKERDIVTMNTVKETTLVFGDCCVMKTRGSLLADKCLLELRVDRNLQPSANHRKSGVADMTINCRLSTLEGSLNVEDYLLIKGVLTYNLGKDTEHILPSVPQNFNSVNTTSEDIWTLSSLRIELLDVKVHLANLACVNFVRSRLIVDSFSDLSQDIDLVSRQILITDERQEKSNVFDVILKPVNKSAIEGVQAEIHSRRRRDKNKFTVLLNNMRLMAIPDWWKLASEFIFHKDDFNTKKTVEEEVIFQQPEALFELKLNITESEVIVVENSAKSDTNAVILRSTTLLTYRQNLPVISSASEGIKPLSCSVNHLELFSCRFLNSETSEDTALSIIDPLTISAELSHNILEIQVHELTIRVSYRDILLFAAILDSFSKQTASANLKKGAKVHSKDIIKLTALGFDINDCEKALEVCKELEDAALWLTQNASPRAQIQRAQSGLDVRTIEIKTSILRFCLIDDCADNDVPLSEATLTNLSINYDLGGIEGPQISNEGPQTSSEGPVKQISEGIILENIISGPQTASLQTTISLDYYNRILGGWEPFLEKWKARAIWRPEDNLTLTRHRIALHSDDILNVNITDSLLELIRLVQDSWTKEIGSPKALPRCPFVPYSLRNDTGSNLFFATLISDPDEPVRSLEDTEDDFEKYQNLKWTEVRPGNIAPFTYHSTHSKQRHAETHQLRSHQLCVQVYGWLPCPPVTVDRVGIYFRSAAPDRRAEPQRITAPRSARIVFEVTLDGSARKLVVVRSAMLLINKLKDPIDVKLVERSAVNAVSTSSRTAILLPFSIFSLPLIHCHSHIFIRPSDEKMSFSYSQPDVPWSRITRPGEKGLFPLRCTTNSGASYFISCEIRRERYPRGDIGHTILLLPILLLVNLLPQDLHFSITSQTTSGEEAPFVIAKGRIIPGQSQAVPSADPDTNLDLSFHIENFKCASGVTLQSSSTVNPSAEFADYTIRVRLVDSERRRLFLRARIEPGRGARIRATITAPFWIINRTGLPLVFKQDGFTADTAGQFEEHELARMVAPLLFSFADQEASPMVVARVGYRSSGTISHGTPHFCQQFHLRRGVQVRRLRVSHENGSDSVYVVGIEVRPARGRTRNRHTSIVTVSPRHQLHNRTSKCLEFAQECEKAMGERNHAPSGCHVPFHWPRLDREQLLCLRVTNLEKTNNVNHSSAWSGGLRIDTPISCHILIRDVTTGVRLYFLHAEVMPMGPTFCLVVSDAGDLPPPLRIDNCSEVAVTFGQSGAHMGPIVAHAHRAVPYAWDEPSGLSRMVVTAPGGVSASYDVDKLGRGTQLTYENFIYIAFTATFNTQDDLDHYDESNYSSTSFPTLNQRQKKIPSNDPIRLQRLVFDVPEMSCNVILSKKQPGKRSQLWRMTSTGQLQHEGSAASNGGPLVLDIEAPAPQPSAPRPSKLALRRPDPRRKTTQTWRFAPDGRLCCAHRNTCVQAMDGLLGLRPGCQAVLGPILLPHRALQGVPLEQSVGKQRMRPGSGLLAVELNTDGPTRVIRITDMKQRELISPQADDDDWQGVALAHRPKGSEISQILTTEMQITIMLRAGLGISIVGAAKELLYLQLNNIIAEAIYGAKSQEFCISIQDLQCDNQLENSTVPVLLHAARIRNLSDLKKHQSLPVLELRAELSPSAGSVLIFKHFIVCLRPLSIHLEENLMLRLYEFFLTASGEKLALDDEENDFIFEEDPDCDSETITGAATLGSTNLTPTIRYHFGIIRLVPGPIRLSVHTAGVSVLTPKLKSLKRRLGLTLVGFEDAPVELEPYVRHHPFETGERLRRSVLDHFRDELLWQAAAILGSVDFLGSPLGLLGDVSEGVSGLIRERSVGALVLNVAHGLSNSAAKVTETLGDGLGRVAMDDAHEEMRQRIRRRHGNSSGSHIVAGIKGLGFGFLGGATGIFKQVYEGAASDGLQGVFSGLGKGLVGAVAKPVVGVLDFASETARAVRDSSRGTSRLIPDRRRPPRATLGPGGLLPPYNPNDSLGQSYLRALSSTRFRSDLTSDLQDTTDINTAEQYVAYECVRSGSDDLRVIVSSERIRVVTAGGVSSVSSVSSDRKLTVVTETRLGELVRCVTLIQDGRHYIEMTVRGTSLRRPLIRCDNEDLARAVTRQINYAKRLYEEATHTLRTQDD